MKIKKIAIGLLSFCLILAIIFVFKNFFISVSVKYLPTELKNVIKSTLNKKNEFLLNTQNINEKLFNDYNVKFLPETQKLKLNFEKYQLQFIPKSEIGYFQNLVEKKGNSYKSFYIDSLDNDHLILTDSSGNSYFVSDINNLNLSLAKLKPVTKNINPTKVLETLTFNNNLFIAYIDTSNENCRNFVISRSEINKKSLNYEEFFREKKCSNFIQGGRMQILNFKDSPGLLFSIADNLVDKPNNLPQSNNSNFGKILFKDFKEKKAIIFSKGHRNPQGLLVQENIILSTEHGPRGGDEINKIEFGKNYGWPIASYGMKYSSNSEYLESHSINGFEEPIFSFIPSIGISEIIKIPDSFNKNWKNNFLVASLNKKSLYRVKFEKNYSKINYFEEIYIGQRIRDIKILNKKIFLALENSGELGVLSAYE